MFKKGLAVLTLALLAAPLFADVELSTSINDVFHRGTNELAGSITMTVTANDFDDASTSEPVFIRVTLDHEARLASTLVDQAGPTATEDPIYLAMVLETAQGGIQAMNADPATVSIVRWVKGESALWLRVQTSSADWISEGPITVSPEEGLPISWSFGISARTSFEALEDLAGLRNLPYNTRDLTATNLTPEDATSTLICVDLSDSSLTTSGIESALEYDIIAFDEQADFGNGVYGEGDIARINFTNDFRIARGKGRACTVGIGAKGGFDQVSMCVPAAFGNDQVNGFIWATNTIEFIINCSRGGTFIQTDLVDGSYLTFDTGARAPYGFHPNDSVNFVGAVSPGDTVLYNPFSSHGDTLYRSVDLIWNDGTKGLLNYHVTASVHLRYHYLDAPTAIDLDYTITLLNHDGEYDSIPFDGDDQTRRCPPSEFVIYEDVWNFGSFVECTGVPVTLFFPYMPKLISDNLFWSGVSLVNHGGVDFDELTVHIYDENGNLFTADLPGLAQRNQYTWLLINDVDAGVVALFDMTEDANGEFVVPAPANPEVPADSFGQTRMSMFVVGNFEAEFANDVFSGDLDGYLLIGKGGDIDGSYLPRNYDNDIPGQNADLPLSRSKASNNSLRAKVVTSSTPAKYSYTNGLPVNK